MITTKASRKTACSFEHQYQHGKINLSDYVILLGTKRIRFSGKNMRWLEVTATFCENINHNTP
jgi:hypothetical protein